MPVQWRSPKRRPVSASSGSARLQRKLSIEQIRRAETAFSGDASNVDPTLPRARSVDEYNEFMAVSRELEESGLTSKDPVESLPKEHRAALQRNSAKMRMPTTHKYMPERWQPRPRSACSAAPTAQNAPKHHFVMTRPYTKFEDHGPIVLTRELEREELKARKHRDELEERRIVREHELLQRQLEVEAIWGKGSREDPGKWVPRDRDGNPIYFSATDELEALRIFDPYVSDVLPGDQDAIPVDGDPNEENEDVKDGSPSNDGTPVRVTPSKILRQRAEARVVAVSPPKPGSTAAEEVRRAKHTSEEREKEEPASVPFPDRDALDGRRFFGDLLETPQETTTNTSNPAPWKQKTMPAPHQRHLPHTSKEKHATELKEALTRGRSQSPISPGRSHKFDQPRSTKRQVFAQKTFHETQRELHVAAADDKLAKTVESKKATLGMKLLRKFARESHVGKSLLISSPSMSCASDPTSNVSISSNGSEEVSESSSEASVDITQEDPGSAYMLHRRLNRIHRFGKSGLPPREASGYVPQFGRSAERGLADDVQVEGSERPTSASGSRNGTKHRLDLRYRNSALAKRQHTWDRMWSKMPEDTLEGTPVANPTPNGVVKHTKHQGSKVSRPTSPSMRSLSSNVSFTGSVKSSGSRPKSLVGKQRRGKIALPPALLS